MALRCCAASIPAERAEPARAPFVVSPARTRRPAKRSSPPGPPLFRCACSPRPSRRPSSPQGPRWAGRLNELLAGTDTRLEMRSRPQLGAAGRRGSGPEARGDDADRAHESCRLDAHRRHPTRPPPPPSEHGAAVYNRQSGAAKDVGVTWFAAGSHRLADAGLRHAARVLQQHPGFKAQSSG